MAVTHPLKDGLRPGGQKYDDATLFHLGHIALPHGRAASAGNDDTVPLLQFHQKSRFQLPEVFLAPGLKDLGNGHSLALYDELVHFYDFCGKDSVAVFDASDALWQALNS